MVEHLALPTLLTRLELDLAAEHVDGRLQVDDAGHRLVLPAHRPAVQRGGGDGLGARYGESGADAGSLVDRRGFAQRPGEPGEDLEQLVGHVGHEVRLLAQHCDLVLKLARVVRADLGAEPVLQRRDDAPAVGVVLGVGAGHDQDVERQPQHVPADLDVPLLHHVEHRDLDALGEVGKLVDGDDAAVAARDEAEVDRLGVAQPPALGHAHRVDVADEVGHGGVGRGELLGVTLLAVPPRDGQVVAELVGAAPALGGDGVERVLTELGPLDHRRPLVEQPDEGAQQTGLALTALAQQHHVVTREQRALQLRHHGVLEAVQPRPRVLAGGELGQQVGAQLLAQGALLVPRGTQLTGGRDLWRGGRTVVRRDVVRRAVRGGGLRIWTHFLTLTPDPGKRNPFGRVGARARRRRAPRLEPWLSVWTGPVRPSTTCACSSPSSRATTPTSRCTPTSPPP
ncbi:hypothetical protein GCM10025872_16580 [Barrientosiimonas endolithica]|uniref:Uncharacterized protein n=1 Tax=Barrientosiimonas endolithica TaxID=1535208 RepID=A0ABM8HAP8_9MICO|nr:hypothetical protein GCM10025872_16580 [Barrientosiimonas endolithica]